MRSTISSGVHLRAAVQGICGQCPVYHLLPAQSASSGTTHAYTPQRTRRYASSSNGTRPPDVSSRRGTLGGNGLRSEHNTPLPPRPRLSLLDDPDTPRRSRRRAQEISPEGTRPDDPDFARPTSRPPRSFLDDPDTPRRFRSRPTFASSAADDANTSPRTRPNPSSRNFPSDGHDTRRHASPPSSARFSPRNALREPPMLYSRRGEMVEVPPTRLAVDREVDPPESAKRSPARLTVDREVDSHESAKRPKRNTQRRHVQQDRPHRHTSTSSSNSEESNKHDATTSRESSPLPESQPRTPSQVLEYLNREARKRDSITLGPRALPLDELLDGVDPDEIGESEIPEDEDTGESAQSTTFRQLADGLSPRVLGVATATPLDPGYTESARNALKPEQAEPLQKEAKRSDDDTAVDKPAERDISSPSGSKTVQRVNPSKDVPQDADSYTNRNSKAQATRPRKTITSASIRSDPSRHLGRGADLSALPKATRESPDKSSRIVGWASIDYQYLIPKLFSKQTISVKSPNVFLRAFPVEAFPASATPPFPPQFFPKRTEAKVVTFGYMATKAKISNRANVRNRAVRRLKSAVDLVVNRGVSLDVEENGWDLVSNEFMYMATVEKSILDVPMEVLCDEVASLLKSLRRKSKGVVARRPGPPSEYQRSRSQQSW